MEQRATAEIELQDAAFVIDGWSVDPSSLRIARGGQEVKLEPKVMAVLEYLASQPGQVVSRQELEDSVWAGTVVGYDAISNAVIKLRKAFGDDAQNSKIIETIPKAGYRLIPMVECLIGASGPQSQVRIADSAVSSGVTESPNVDAPIQSPRSKFGSTQAVVLLLLLIVAVLVFEPWESRVEPAEIERMAFPLPDKPSIAVLPFNNLSASTEQEYFVDGFTEDLITDLSKLPDLFVVARNSVFYL